MTAGSALALMRPNAPCADFRWDVSAGCSRVRIAERTAPRFGSLLEIKLEVRMQLGELPPHNGLEKASRRRDHDRRRALPRISKGRTP
jgi:hypothetical protein